MTFTILGREQLEKGGIYAITGPNWNGQIPAMMQEIKSPTNSMLLLSRILVKGPRELSNVTSIENQPRDLSNVTIIENQIMYLTNVSL